MAVRKSVLAAVAAVAFRAGPVHGVVVPTMAMYTDDACKEATVMQSHLEGCTKTSPGKSEHRSCNSTHFVTKYFNDEACTEDKRYHTSEDATNECTKAGEQYMKRMCSDIDPRAASVHAWLAADQYSSAGCSSSDIVKDGSWMKTDTCNPEDGASKMVQCIDGAFAVTEFTDAKCTNFKSRATLMDCRENTEDKTWASYKCSASAPGRAISYRKYSGKACAGTPTMETTYPGVGTCFMDQKLDSATGKWTAGSKKTVCATGCSEETFSSNDCSGTVQSTRKHFDCNKCIEDDDGTSFFADCTSRVASGSDSSGGLVSATLAVMLSAALAV